MSEYGEVFHERMYQGDRLRSPGFTDVDRFVSFWQELSEARKSTADQALSELVDGLDPDEYVATVHAFIGELELFHPPFTLQGEGFYMSGAKGDIGMLPDGVFYRRVATDRRTIHRTIASMQDELEGNLHDRGLSTSLDCFQEMDYGYTRPPIRIVDGWHIDKRELDERHLEAKVHELVADSNIWIFGKDNPMKVYRRDVHTNRMIATEYPSDRFWINEKATADLIDYVADRLPAEDRVLFAQEMDYFFETLTAARDAEGYDVYSPFFDQYTYGQSWEVEATDGDPGSIYQVIGTWDGMISGIKNGISDNEDQLNDDEWTSERFLRFLGLFDEHNSLRNGQSREFLLAVRGHPKLQYPEKFIT